MGTFSCTDVLVYMLCTSSHFRLKLVIKQNSNSHQYCGTDPLISVHTEQSCMVPLLYDDEGDARLVVLL